MFALNDDAPRFNRVLKKNSSVYLVVLRQWNFKAEGLERVTCTAMATADLQTKLNKYLALATSRKA
jgi:hypothetical protein